MKKAKGRVRGIMLDLDGTVVDSRAAYLEAARKAFQRFGQKTLDTKTALEIPRRLEQNQQLDDIVGTNVTGFLDVYLKQFYATTLKKTKPFPNIDKTLMYLSQKAKLALITMRFVPKATVVSELKHFGIAEYFAHVITALDTPNPKPSPEAIVKTATLLHVDLSDCVVVGDSISDLKAGKAAGVTTVAVVSGLFSREEIAREKPDLILRNVAELPRYL